MSMFANQCISKATVHCFPFHLSWNRPQKTISPKQGPQRNIFFFHLNTRSKWFSLIWTLMRNDPTLNRTTFVTFSFSVSPNFISILTMYAIRGGTWPQSTNVPSDPSGNYGFRWLTLLLASNKPRRRLDNMDRLNLSSDAHHWQLD